MSGFSRQQAACPGSRFNENSLFSLPRKPVIIPCACRKGEIVSEARSCLISDRPLVKGCQGQRCARECPALPCLDPEDLLCLMTSLSTSPSFLFPTSIYYPCCHTKGGKLLVPQLNCKLHLCVYTCTTRNTTTLKLMWGTCEGQQSQGLTNLTV